MSLKNLWKTKSSCSDQCPSRHGSIRFDLWILFVPCPERTTDRPRTASPAPYDRYLRLGLLAGNRIHLNRSKRQTTAARVRQTRHGRRRRRRGRLRPCRGIVGLNRGGGPSIDHNHQHHGRRRIADSGRIRTTPRLRSSDPQNMPSWIYQCRKGCQCRLC